MNYINTYTGIKFNILKPKLEDINILDIAHALSNICRFGGHSQRFYSVAQHSGLVANLLPVHLSCAGLLHDAAEAYIGDVIRPLKYSSRVMGYKDLEFEYEYLIREKFSISLSKEDEELIKETDEIVLHTEARQLLNSKNNWYKPEISLAITIYPQQQELAREIFLSSFSYFTSQQTKQQTTP